MKSLVLTFISLCSWGLALSQPVYNNKEETRAVWVATVYNLDWPISSTAPPSFQQSDMITLFNRLKTSGINTVYFQVRTFCDALYASNYEPWSRFVTGTQGKEPSPMWDPLQYAVKLAHERGMELHAWLNPYRARTNPGKIAGNLNQYPELFSGVEGMILNEAQKKIMAENEITSTEHVTVKHPDWILDVGTIGILNPGMDEVVQYITDVTMDIVNRYDVDGIHFDDYFYPYPPNEIGSQDLELYNSNKRGFTNIGDWRRDNINRMIQSVYDSILTVKPFVKFGISPFGIWKSGTPPNASGMSAYSTIYADAVAWLDGKYVDYLVPQLYWPFNTLPVGQDFGLLAGWWGSVRNGRHMITGHGAYRSDGTSFTGSLFNANEMPRQIRFMRNNGNLHGSSFFRARNITHYRSQGLKDSLINNYYRFPAIPPHMAWKDSTIHPAPTNLTLTEETFNETEIQFKLTWNKVSIESGTDTTVKYGVYRVTQFEEPSREEAFSDISNLIAVTGLTTFTDTKPGLNAPNWYFVTTISRNSVESEASNKVQSKIITSVDENTALNLPQSIKLEQNFPNPFNPSTSIRFSLPQASYITIIVYDMVGRVVGSVAKGNYAAGSHIISFNASDLSTGVYIYTLSTSYQTVSKRMILIK